jgi:hypothetical protein
MSNSKATAAQARSWPFEAFRPGRFVTALTIFYAWTKLTSQPLARLIATPFALYRDFVEWLTSPLEPIIEDLVLFFGSIIRIDLDINPNWKFFIVPLFLYFSRDAFELLARGRWATALGGGVIAAFILLFCCIQVSNSVEIQLGLPMGGLAIYALVQTYLTSRIHTPDDQSFGETFFYYIRNTFLPTAAMAFAAFALGSLLARSFPVTFGPAQAVAGAMLLYVLLMALYWLAMAREVAARDGHDVKDLGSHKLAVGILQTMRWVAILLITNWLFNLADYPTV